MYPRTNYEMTEEDLTTMLAASQPVRCMQIGSYSPRTPQENANRAWAALGKKMGFDHMTVRPHPSKGNRFFSAVPSETEPQRVERLAKGAKEKRAAEIAALKRDISDKQAKLHQLEQGGE